MAYEDEEGRKRDNKAEKEKEIINNRWVIKKTRRLIWNGPSSDSKARHRLDDKSLHAESHRRKTSHPSKKNLLPLSFGKLLHRLETSNSAWK